MIPRRRLTAWAGQAAALLFGLMWVVLEWHVRPEAGTIPLPQSNFSGYSNADVAALAQTLGPDVLATYRAILLYLDPAYIACFVAFFALLFWPRRWPLMLAAAYALADLNENRLILQALSEPVVLPIQHTSSAYLSTLVKFVLFGACLATLLWALWQNRLSPTRSRG
ncbi:hypothetical protein ACFO5X_11665 [Seohaeicola nanhaiensis]|uniref:Uncharacterized protein n=1 Tax=Seohaeicola nanhaiensis TaxID=1387282 RepID=A0ABV9KGH0_9RHOB